MYLGSPWGGAYLEPQQKEQYSFMFINILPTIHQTIPGIIPMGFGAPWSNAYLETQQNK